MLFLSFLRICQMIYEVSVDEIKMFLLNQWFLSPQFEATLTSGLVSCILNRVKPFLTNTPCH